MMSEHLFRNLFLFLASGLTTAPDLADLSEHEQLVREVVGIFKAMITFPFMILAAIFLYLALGNFLSKGRFLKQIENLLKGRDIH